jgi:hypothetical protein
MGCNPCSSAGKQRFGGKYRLNLHTRKVTQEQNDRWERQEKLSTIINSIFFVCNATYI